MTGFHKWIDGLREPWRLLAVLGIVVGITVPIALMPLLGLWSGMVGVAVAYWLVRSRERYLERGGK